MPHTIGYKNNNQNSPSIKTQNLYCKHKDVTWIFYDLVKPNTARFRDASKDVRHAEDEAKSRFNRKTNGTR